MPKSFAKPSLPIPPTDAGAGPRAVCCGLLVACTALLCSPLVETCRAGEVAVDQESLRAAITKSVRLLESSSRMSRDERTCFMCHHQAMPTLALVAARDAGFDVDAENLKAQSQRAADHLQRGRTAYEEGRGQGGKTDTAGYALWTLAVTGYTPDDITAPVVSYLLQRNAGTDHWKCSSDRPPSESSDFTTSYLAIYGLQRFASAEQKEEVSRRLSAVREWLETAEPQETEDAVFRLMALEELGAESSVLKDAARALRDRQQDDGGWKQKDDMTTDAYATATALVALATTGHAAVQDPAYQRGLRFLLKHQQQDGTWHVPSRSRPFQTYFESGYPHKKDQFISITAASWATWALTLAIEQER